MRQAPRDPLSTLDAALLRLRRFSEAPRGDSAPGPRENIEISTVLVVDAVEQLSEQGGTVTVGAVAARLSVAPSTASRLIERAVTTGMVERGRAASDARRVALMLTDEGIALAERARSYRRDRLADVLASWPPERIECFSVDLQAFAEAALTPREAIQQ